MRTLLLAVAACFAFHAHAADEPKKPPVTLDFRLEPGKIHEECMKLAKDQAKRFEWTSDTNIDFNVHYHKGQEAFYPFKANNRKAAKARFVADHADEYCWMWIAKKEPATVRGSIK
ncbi:hypothetical protein [Usitatibacter palustris]|uniref:HdeA/HdeB family protein n=1 Tax=Usitatibacter palustris TaxID=2732487 RepID=A0A6M4HA24_9PROT|nr:hypothetical protein [Usitatibacter palustris]QJR15718.1 hypothetical protein DSM104440_02544 [Usitatibacter palustris]